MLFRMFRIRTEAHLTLITVNRVAHDNLQNNLRLHQEQLYQSYKTRQLKDPATQPRNENDDLFGLYAAHFMQRVVIAFDDRLSTSASLFLQ
jgi:hypothetical protein